MDQRNRRITNDISKLKVTIANNVENISLCGDSLAFGTVLLLFAVIPVMAGFLGYKANKLDKFTRNTANPRLKQKKKNVSD